MPRRVPRRVVVPVAVLLAAALAACGGGGASPATTPAAPGAGDRWQPRAGATWQWQLNGTVDTAVAVEVYDIDWEESAAVVAALHAAGRKVICYVNVGAWEDWRRDAAEFPAAVLGADYAGWPGERYLDVRSAAVRAVMARRLDACQAKGFDAVEPDNLDVFELGAASGFPLTEGDGVAYARWLADAAHARGLGIGQKNARSITAQLASSYDWALTESCYSDGSWCGDVAVYVAAGKPVFMCEYAEGSFAAACAWAAAHGYSAILKARALEAPVTFCR
jgi:hypothetical protein